MTCSPRCRVARSRRLAASTWKRVADAHPRHPFHYVLCDLCHKQVLNDVDHATYLGMLGADGMLRDRHDGCGGFLIGVTCSEPSPSFE